MQTDDESPITLSKWPFYLGDVLLVATALAIGILGDWQLSNWQVVSCVLAVALGAALFVLPYIVEFQIRVREEAEDRSGALRVLTRHVRDAEALMAAADERIDELAERVAAQAQSADFVAAAVDQKFAFVDSFKEEQAGALLALRARIEHLDAAQGEAGVVLGRQLEALEQRLAGVASVKVLEELVQRVEKLERAPVSVTPVADAGVAKAASIRASRERRKPESRLLHRAIKEKQDSASSAVSRIISAKVAPRPAEPVVEVDGGPEVPAVVAEPSPDAGNDCVDATVEVSDVEVSLPEQVVQSESKQEATPAAPVAEELREPELVVASEPELASASEPELASASEPEVTSESESESESESAPVDMFAEAVPSLPRGRARTKQADAVLTASIFIGIGNKPFLRGNGGGLSWEKGVVMDFEEIGKWRWVAPPGLDEPVELQIYRNDEDPDRKGKLILEPGQKLEVSPVF